MNGWRVNAGGGCGGSESWIGTCVCRRVSVYVGGSWLQADSDSVHLVRSTADQPEAQTSPQHEFTTHLHTHSGLLHTPIFLHKYLENALNKYLK